MARHRRKQSNVRIANGIVISVQVYVRTIHSIIKSLVRVAIMKTTIIRISLHNCTRPLGNVGNLLSWSLVLPLHSVRFFQGVSR